MKLDLKPLRKAKGLSQQQLADKLGVSRQHYVAIENNQTESLNKAHLDLFLEIFDCGISDLFDSSAQASAAIPPAAAEKLDAAEQALASLRSALGL